MSGQGNSEERPISRMDLTGLRGGITKVTSLGHRVHMRRLSEKNVPPIQLLCYFYWCCLIVPRASFQNAGMAEFVPHDRLQAAFSIWLH